MTFLYFQKRLKLGVLEYIKKKHYFITNLSSFTSHQKKRELEIEA